MKATLNPISRPVLYSPLMKHSPELAKQASKTCLYRRRILALSLPLAAVLYIACEASAPRGSDQIIGSLSDAHRLLAVASNHPAQVCMSGAFGIVSLGLLIIAYMAIAGLVKGRGAKLATIAALIGGLGAFAGAITNVFVFPVLAAAASSHISTAAASQFLFTAFTSRFVEAFSFVYFLSEFIAPFLMGLALWRSKVVPGWLAALFFIGLQVAELMTSGGPIVILFMLSFAIAMFLLAGRIWKTAPHAITLSEAQ